MNIGTIAGSIGRGLAAGAAGTAVMTVSSTLEAKLRKREASTAPADAAGKVLGVKPEGDDAKARFSNLVHWGYGTGWGAARGLLGGLGLVGPAGTVAHFGLVWGSELVMLPRLDVAPPVKEWGTRELGVDAFHHMVYAVATGSAFVVLDRLARP